MSGVANHTGEKETEMTTMTDSEARVPASSAATPLYRATGVTRTYTRRGRTVTALTGVDLEIMPGAFVTIQGPTGGQVDAAAAAGALDTPTAGTLQLDGRELSSASPSELGRIRAQEIGFVFQGFNLIPTLTAVENVDMALEPLGIDRAERRTRVAAALAHVGLADRGDHRPAELSGGQQQRVAIARAIVKRPECCSRTSRRATSTRACATRSSTSSNGCARRASPWSWSRTTPRWRGGRRNGCV